ncbi:E2-like enzyme [Lodderomyces elongisporus]|uniref:E2-like enzyme n=1 Tax=Lodderomyces elongisporus TaxID=36914 RepID=UPI00291D2E22|nr:E2-like enzyme [Lodderomyces elongisporus]WLF77616.1 E2-like enzyme [Lodderomyces elongisporus]
MLRSKLSSLREYLTPINHNSNFLTTGEISPEEFVKAGDYLVYKFPTWQWASCPKDLQKSFLPTDKQVLVTRHVPSHQRANEYFEGEFEVEIDEKDRDLALGNESNLKNGENGENDDEAEYGWIRSGRSSSEKGTGEVSDPQRVEEVNDIDELIDETAEGEEEEEEGEEGEGEGNGNGADFHADDDADYDDLDIVQGSHSKLRRYDLYITYSTSYRVPKLYLVGFDANGIPLLPQQMFEDINSDYKDKTATIEQLPVAHNTTSVSIHPCKHSSVMRVLMKHQRARREHENVAENMKRLSIGSEDHKEAMNHIRRLSAGSKELAQKQEEPNDSEIKVDSYLVIFLKFIASVTPGIEYDYTMDAL